jgi:hypothetical protein
MNKLRSLVLPVATWVIVLSCVFVPAAQALTMDQLIQAQVLDATTPTLIFTALGCNANNRCNYRINYSIPASVTSGYIKIGRSVRIRNIIQSGSFDTGFILKKQFSYAISFWNKDSANIGHRLARLTLRAADVTQDQAFCAANSQCAADQLAAIQAKIAADNAAALAANNTNTIQPTNGYVNSPQEGTVWKYNSQQTISWNLPGTPKVNIWLVPASGFTVNPVRFDLLASSGTCGLGPRGPAPFPYPVAVGIANSGSYTFTVNNPTNWMNYNSCSAVPPVRNADGKRTTSGQDNYFRFYVEGVANDPNGAILDGYNNFSAQHPGGYVVNNGLWAVSGAWSTGRDTTIPADQFGNLIPPDQYVTYTGLNYLGKTADGKSQYKLSWTAGTGLKQLQIEMCWSSVGGGDICANIPTNGYTDVPALQDAQAGNFTFTLDSNAPMMKNDLFQPYAGGKVYFRFRSATSQYLSLPSPITTLTQ